MPFGAPWSRPFISLTVHSVRGVLRKATQGGQVGGESPAGVALPHCDRNRLVRPGVGGSPTRPVRAQTGRRTSRAGRPLHLLSMGHARRAVLVVAGAHANEPTGGSTAADAGRTGAARAGVAGRHLLALPALRGPGRREPPCDAGAAHPARLPPRLLPPGRARAAGVVARPSCRPTGCRRRPAPSSG